MRRFPSGCTTDKHPLYSIFMGKLSQCVFKWDEDDLQLLTTAKREEMILQGVVNPSEKDVRRNLSSTELALHCKRVTPRNRGDPNADIRLDTVIGWPQRVRHIRCPIV